MRRSPVWCIVALLASPWPVGHSVCAATGGRPAPVAVTPPSPIAQDDSQRTYAFAVGAATVGRIDDAIRAIDQQLTALPTDAAAWNLKGLLVARIDPPAALRALRRSIELDATMPHTWANLALALYRQGEVRALQETLRLAKQKGIKDPVLALVRARLGTAIDPLEGRLSLRRFTDALEQGDPVLGSMVRQEVQTDLGKLEAALAIAGRETSRG